MPLPTPARPLLLLLLLLLASTRALDEQVRHPEPTSDGSSPEWVARQYADDHILTLTTATFDGARRAHAPAGLLVMFHAPWCSHCRLVMPEFASAADALSARGSAVRLAKVDAVAEEGLAQELEVPGYPTMLWFHGAGDEPLREYRGGRSKEDFISWVTRRSGPPSVALASVAAAAEWLDGTAASSTVGVLALLPRRAAVEGEKGGLLEAYEALATTYADVAFAHTFDPRAYATLLQRAQALPPRDGASALPSLRADIAAAAAAAAAAVAEEGATEEGAGVRPAALLVKPHDERLACHPPADLTASAAAAAARFADGVSGLVAAHQLPIVVPFTEAYEEALYGGAVRHHIVVLGARSAFESRLPSLRAVGLALRGVALVITADTDDGAADGLRDFFRLGEGAGAAEGGGAPEGSGGGGGGGRALHYFGYDLDAHTKHLPHDAASTGGLAAGAELEARLIAFGRELAEKRAPPFRLSEPAPTDPSGDVVVVVADTFDTTVGLRACAATATADAAADLPAESAGPGSAAVLLMVYAPWCGHCKAAGVALEQLGRAVRDASLEERLLLAKMDGTRNVVPSLEVDAYPTLLLYSPRRREGGGGGGDGGGGGSGGSDGGGSGGDGPVQAGADVEISMEGVSAWLREHGVVLPDSFLGHRLSDSGGNPQAPTVSATARTTKEEL